MHLPTRSVLFYAASMLLAVPLSVRAVNIEMVTVGNPGNVPDTRYNNISVGSVGYVYQIGKYEITAGQYTEFLNAVAKSDPNGLYNLELGPPDNGRLGVGIVRNGSSPNYSYSVAADWADRPVDRVTLWNAARFANWLHNSQPIGEQGPGTTEDGAYHDVGNQALFGRNAGAKFFVPSENEWYKAAYHDKSAGLAAIYFDYPTATNSEPGRDMSEATMPGNNANYNLGNGRYLIGSPYYRTIVGEFELSASPYGTFDQAGNVHEWTETKVASLTRAVRGGSYYDPAVSNLAQLRPNFTPQSLEGFRIASIPEPSTIVLAFVALIVITHRRRQPIPHNRV